MDLRFWNRPRICSRRMILEALEERIVMDAAMDQIPQDNSFGGRHPDMHDSSALDPWHSDGGRHSATDERIMPVHSALADTATGSLAHGVSQAASHGLTAPATHHDPLSRVFNNQGLDIVLVSTDADKYDAITHAVNQGASALVFDPATENLKSLSAKLHDLTSSVGKKIEHLAIVAPGTAGHLRLGADDITAKDVDSHQGEFKALAQSLTSDARIDLYGCDIAQGTDGANLVNKVASATGVKVWASNDVTGTVPGANWDLEVKSAPDSKPYMIDSHALSSYQIHLAPPISEDTVQRVNKDFTSPAGVSDYTNFTYRFTIPAVDVDNPVPANASIAGPGGVGLPTLTQINGGGVHGAITAAVGGVYRLGDPAPTLPAGYPIQTGIYGQDFTYTPNALDADRVWTGDQQVDYSVQTVETAHDAVLTLGVPAVGNQDWASAVNTATGDLYVDEFNNQQVQVYQRVGAGFNAPVDASALGAGSGVVQAIALGDVNGDGTPDLILACNGTSGNWTSGWVAGVAGTPVTFPGLVNAFPGLGALNATSLAVKQRTLVSGVDILVGINTAGNSNVLFDNNGAGGLLAGVPIGAPQTTSSVAFGDLNCDGIPDLAQANHFGDTQIYLGNAAPPTITAVPSTAIPDLGGVDTTAVAIGQIRELTVGGNPVNDVVVGNQTLVGGHRLIPTLWYEQDETAPGTFFTASPHEMNYTGGQTRTLQIADINGDGHMDIIEGNWAGQNMYFPGDGHQIVETDGVNIFPQGDQNTWGGLFVGDLDGDTIPDVVASHWTAPVSASFGANVASEWIDGQMVFRINGFDNPPENLFNGAVIPADPNTLPAAGRTTAADGTVLFDVAHANLIQIRDRDRAVNRSA